MVVVGIVIVVVEVVGVDEQCTMKIIIIIITNHDFPMNICVYVYKCMCLPVCIHVCMYVCMYVCVYVCIHVCILYVCMCVIHVYASPGTYSCVQVR